MREQSGADRCVAPVVTNRKGFYTDLAKWALAKAVSHLRVDGEYLPTKGWPRLDRFREHTIELPVAEVEVRPENEKKLRAAVEAALEMGKGVLHVCCGGWGDRETQIYSVKRACPSCGRSFPELDPRLFSTTPSTAGPQPATGTGVKIDESGGTRSAPPRHPGPRARLGGGVARVDEAAVSATASGSTRRRSRCASAASRSPT